MTSLTPFTHEPLFGVIAIVFQMVGFVLMIKYYDKRPKLEEVQKLITKEATRHPDDLKYERQVDLESYTGGRGEPMAIPKSVFNYLERRRKFPLFLVLFGLALQIFPFVT